MAVNIGPKIGIEGEAEYRKQINNIIQQTKTLNSEMKALTSTFDKEGASIKQNKAQKEILTKQIETQKARINELNSMLEQSTQKYGENDTKTQKWAQAVNEATADLNKMEAELKSMPSSLDIVGQKFTAVGDKIKAVGDKMSAIGTTMSVAVTAPIVAGGTKMVQSYAEVDKTMVLANKTMRNSAEEAKILEDAMKSAAANSTFGMNDAATASLNFARAGLDAKEAAAALAPAMNLAAGEGGDLDTVSAGLVATINGFHGSFDEASKYADVFAAACNNSALDVDSLSESMSVAAPIFSSAGYAVDDAALYLGIMANNGIEADKAANSLKTGLARLVSPAKQGAVAMDNLGFSITNADGTMKSTVQIQSELHDAFAALSESEQIAAASAIFGKNQMAPWLALINTAPSDVAALNDQLDGASMSIDSFSATLEGSGISLETMGNNLKSLGLSQEDLISALNQSSGSAQQFATNLLEWANAGTTSEQVIQALGGDLGALQTAMDSATGTTEEMAEAMMGGFGGSIEKMKSSLDVLGYTLGGIIAQYVGPMITKVQEWIDKFQSLDSGTQDLIVKIAAVAAAVGPVLMIGGKIVGAIGTLSSAIGVILPILGTVGGAIASVGMSAIAALPGVIAFLAPFAPFIAIGAAVVAAGVLIYKNWDKIKEVAGNLGNAIKEKWEGIKAKTSEVWGNVKETITGAVDAVKNNVGERLGRIKSAFEQNGGGIKGVVAAGWQGIKEYYRVGFDVLNTLTGGKLGEIKDAFFSKFREIRDSALNWGKDMIQSLIDGIRAKISAVRDAVRHVADTIKSYLHFSEPDIGPLSDFHTWMPDMMKGLSQGMISNLNTVKAASAEVAGAIAQPMTANNYNYGGFTIVVNGAEGQDVNALADAVAEKINSAVMRGQAAWA